MGSKPWLVLSLLLLAANCMQQCVHGIPEVPCIFIFGDSLSDNGNNNNLPTAAKVNYRPYGIDFPLGPTGRFTNGRTAVDLIAQHLGFENFIPPYANTSGSDILRGVNYASGAAGIRPETGTLMGPNVNLGQQMRNHRVIYSRIAMRLGGFERANRYLNKCLYYVNIGSNDYINNYFQPDSYSTSRIYTPQQYADNLVFQLSQHIQALHDNVGARKFVIVGMSDIGCAPVSISTHSTNGLCVEAMNDCASMFNDNLKSLVDQYNLRFFLDSRAIFIDSFGNPASSLGSTVESIYSCCPTGSVGLCVPNELPCPIRSLFLFWDNFHPTEAVNQITALKSYNGSNPISTYPMNIKQLAHF